MDGGRSRLDSLSTICLKGLMSGFQTRKAPQITVLALPAQAGAILRAEVYGIPRPEWASDPAQVCICNLAAQLAYAEPTSLACAYVRGHLRNRLSACGY